jgi:hypothetical protein
MRIQFSTNEATSSPQLIDSLWFENPLGGSNDVPAKIDPPDNTGGGSTGSGSNPEPEEEEGEASS